MEFERRASLNWDQFDVIVGLLDEALRYEGMSYNTVIAPTVLDLATRISTVRTACALETHSGTLQQTACRIVNKAACSTTPILHFFPSEPELSVGRVDFALEYMHAYYI